MGKDEDGLLTKIVVRMWKVPSTCLKPLPGTHESPENGVYGCNFI